MKNKFRLTDLSNATLESNVKPIGIEKAIEQTRSLAINSIKEASKGRWVYYVCGCIVPYATETEEATMGCKEHALENRPAPILKVSSLLRAKYRILDKVEVLVIPGTTLKKKEHWYSVHHVAYDDLGFPRAYNHTPVNKKQYQRFNFLVNIFKKTSILEKEEVELMLSDTILTESDLISVGKD